MHHTSDDLRDVHPVRQYVALALAVAATVPGVVVSLTDPDLSPLLGAAVFGLAIVGAAFVLSWAAEAAQLDISAGLALAVLALIAVLPEYAVDLVFARQGGEAFAQYGAACGPPGVAYDDTPCSFALANMTGANRLLIGIGWSMVVFIAWWRVRSLRRRSSAGSLTPMYEQALAEQSGEGITLERSHSVELAFLAAATIYSLTLPLKTTITLFDAAVLVGLFVLYTVRISRAPAEEPHLVGPARVIGGFTAVRRRIAVVAMFAFSATVILLCAEHFAEALVESGEALGIPSFFLVQWLAPLASEAPELLVAGLYAWRLNTNAGLGTLVSSKVNQWTLLVGTLPIVFAIASGGPNGLPLDVLQREELFLTAAQSFFAVALLGNLSISVREALALFLLFWAQFVLGAAVPEEFRQIERVGLGIVYMVLGLWILLRNRGRLPKLLRDGLRTPYSELSEQD